MQSGEGTRQNQLRHLKISRNQQRENDIGEPSNRRREGSSLRSINTDSPERKHWLHPKRSTLKAPVLGDGGLEARAVAELLPHSQHI